MSDAMTLIFDYYNSKELKTNSFFDVKKAFKKLVLFSVTNQ
jgi:hypothetical protein